MPFRPIFADDPRYADTNPPDSDICKHCGKIFYAGGFLNTKTGAINWHKRWASDCACDGATEERAKRIREELRKKQIISERTKQCEVSNHISPNYGVYMRHRKRDFKTFETDEHNKAAYSAAVNFCRHFESLVPAGAYTKTRNGLFITGGCGTGKTHLAIAIVNGCEKPFSRIYLTAGDFFDKIIRSETADIKAIVKRVTLLVLDDLGKEMPSERTTSILFDVINTRYEASLPTVITSNYDIPSLIKRLSPTL